MYLKRLYIHGFKSFAGVSKLDFEPGISAIVGPNGSGKSNIADAIRWALGEQSTRNLRLKKNDEVIFAGTEKRAKASLAEVRLLFDNSAGKLQVDASEIEISRLLYRSGETEYRLNGKKAPLKEIQQILGEAGFGANSYSVIGQGTIDSFILATPSERKLLFDEASGIRVYELGRKSALAKLAATEANMVRIRDILGELAPRVSSLATAAQAAELQIKHRASLKVARSRYYGTALAAAITDQANCEQSVSRLTLRREENSRQLVRLRDLQAALAEAEKKHAGEQKQASRILLDLEMKRDSLANDLSVKRAELQHMVEQQETAGQEENRLQDLHQRREQLEAALPQLEARLEQSRRLEADATVALEGMTSRISEAQIQLNALRHDNLESSQREYVQHALGILKQLALDLRAEITPPITEQMRLMIHKAGRLLSLASSKDATQGIADIRRAQTSLSELMAEREKMHDHYTDVVIGVRSVELDIASNRKQFEELGSEIQRFGDEQLLRHNKLETGILARKEQLDKLEHEAALVQHQLDERRKQLATRPTASKEIFELASTVETTSAEGKRLAAELAQTHERLSQSTSEQKRLTNEVAKLGLSTSQLEDTTQTLWTLEREVVTLEAKLEDAPQNSADTQAEYHEATERFDFLSGQLVDLDRASTSLNQAIESFQKLIKERFEESFHEISTHFSTYFQQLFGGGKASLALSSDETETYGIEIVAVPPGKKVESLAVLSGGERSLVGIALLAAILRVNPSPFVVLDEVDAALDEANSGRFSKILSDIGKSAQFLVITHNRQTMRAAHSLFGVSMDDQHISSLLSMRLEAAEELASEQMGE